VFAVGSLSKTAFCDMYINPPPPPPPPPPPRYDERPPSYDETTSGAANAANTAARMVDEALARAIATINTAVELQVCVRWSFHS
jgi:hypothetical protein